MATKIVQGKGIPSPNSINGCNGENDICDMWYLHFKDLLNSSQDSSFKSEILAQVKKKCNSFNISECLFSQQDVRKAVHSLKKSKSAGLDSISAEHFINASERVIVLLCLFFNSCIVHGYLPIHLMDTVLNPIVKDKKGDITDKHNYRPGCFGGRKEKL